MDQPEAPAPDFTALIDLAAGRLGGRTLLAGDEFFAPASNLLKPEPPVFIEGRFTDCGKWMDGWESRRKRTPGHDWCIIRLGLPGAVRGVTVDTTHFRGNAPEACSLEACEAAPDATGGALAEAGVAWREIVPKTPIRPHAENHFRAHDVGRATHVRLNIFPDGGVARLRLYGDVAPDWGAILAGAPVVDLAAVEHGALPVACSDQFFGEPRNLIMPGRGVNMGDGWETKRRRGPGHDWVVLRLGRRGVVERLVVDTNHFKGNYPDTCSVEAADAPGWDGAAGNEPEWREILPRTKLEAHREHIFERELKNTGPATHLRLNIHPDGGVSRLRAFGRPVEEST